MFPKSERIVKAKEIQKSLKAQFRGSCIFGQILLSQRSNSQVKNLVKNPQETKTQANSKNLIKRLVQNKIQTLDFQNQEKSGQICQKSNSLNIESQLKTELKTENIISKNILNYQNKEIVKIPKTVDFAGFRLLCVVPKKIHKKANQRNKIRRRVLAIFLSLKSQKRLPPNLDCVIIIRSKDILTATFEDYQKIFVSEVANLYQKILKKNSLKISN